MIIDGSDNLWSKIGGPKVDTPYMSEKESVSPDDIC
jgi:hypothetical protein